MKKKHQTDTKGHDDTLTDTCYDEPSRHPVVRYTQFRVRSQIDADCDGAQGRKREEEVDDIVHLVHDDGYGEDTSNREIRKDHTKRERWSLPNAKIQADQKLHRVEEQGGSFDG